MLRNSYTVDPNRISSGAIAQFFLGIVDRVTAPLTQPRLDLVFGGDVAPYLQTADIMDEATNRLVRGRWYRVGVLNRSPAPVPAVQVQLWKVEPPEFPIVPVTLHFMHDNPPPGTPYRLSMDVPAGQEPTVFVDVLARAEKQPVFQVIHTVPNVPRRRMPARQYAIALRVTGQYAREAIRHFSVGLNEDGEVTMVAVAQPRWWQRGPLRPQR